MIKNWRHKGLAELFETGASAKVRADQQKRCLRILDTLDKAISPDDMNVPGWNLHSLRGKPQRFAVAVNGPWRITFGFDLGDAIDVDLEQYH